MNCWYCKTELIWGGDHDIETGGFMDDEYDMVTNLSCPSCNAHIDVYHSRENLKDDVT